jgi:small nuclear ribonucleoprotein D3|tara:strand:+ start:64 stop:405 length:342 start_codon:yes stop_codon:yes gene_type:complete
MSGSVPLALLHEGEGHTVTIELKNGVVYRGNLEGSDDTMNCQLSSVTMMARDGSVTKLEHVYLRGSHVRFMVLPDLLKQAPVFKKVGAMHEKWKKAREEKGRGRGRGRGAGGR